MKVALAQIAPRLGDVESNLDLHLEWIEQARKERVDLLVFPELSLAGYTLKDLVETAAMNPRRDPRFRKLLSHSRSLAVVAGFVEEREEEKGLFYNSAAFLAGGEIVHIHRKMFLPTYGLFEEGKFFAPGKDFRAFPTPFGRAGLMICRDFLHFGAGYLLFAGGAEIVIVLSAAPGRGLAQDGGFQTSRMWSLMGEAMSFFTSSFVLYCNRVGTEDGVTFAGGSFIYGPGGRLLSRADEVEPGLLLHVLDLTAIRETRKVWTFKRDEKPELILRSLERIVRSDDR